MPDRPATLGIATRQAQAGVLEPGFEEAPLASPVAAPGLEGNGAERALDEPAAAPGTAGEDAVAAEHDGRGEHIARLETHQDEPPTALAQDLHFVERDDERLAFARDAQDPVVAGTENRRTGRLVVGAQREEGLALAGAADEISSLADQAVAA